MRSTFSENRIEIFTGIRVDRDKWDSEKLKVKPNTFNKQKQSASDINSKVSEYENEIQNIFKKYELEEQIPTVEDIKFCFNSAFNNGQVIIKAEGFFEYFDDFTIENDRIKNWTIRTYEKFSSVRKHLFDFNSKLYVEFLRDKLKMRNSTIEKQVSFLK